MSESNKTGDVEFGKHMAALRASDAPMGSLSDLEKSMIDPNAVVEAAKALIKFGRPCEGSIAYKKAWDALKCSLSS